MSAFSSSPIRAAPGPQGLPRTSAFASISHNRLRTGWRFLLLAILIGASSAHAQDRVSEDSAAADSGTDTEWDDLFGDDDLDDGGLFGEAGEAPEGESPPRDDSAATENREVDAVDDTLAEPVSTESIDARVDDRQGPSADVEEILVQGQAARGIAVDAAVSATQFDAAELEALGVQDVSDVAQFTPNLEIRTFSATSGTFFIRGVGLNDFTANAAGAIAIFQDDVQMDLPAIQLSQLFDVELEILRGPQGSGPNRNASGGSIRIYSRKPTGENAGSLRASYGRFNERDFEGTLELPLLADILSARFAFRLSQRDPIMDNRCGNAPPIGLERVFNPNIPPQPGICGETQLRVPIPNPSPPPRQYRISALPTGIEEELNDRNNWAARTQLRFVPPDFDMDWLLNLHGGRLDQLPEVGQSIGTIGFAGGKTGFFGGRTKSGYRPEEIAAQEEKIYQELGGGTPIDPEIRDQAQLELGRRLARNLDRKPFEGDFNRDGHETQTTAGGFLRGDLELGFGQLTTITGAEYYERNRNFDADYTSDRIFEFLIDDEAWQFTQDFQLSGELDTLPVQWETGVSYLMGELNYDQRTVPSPVVTDVSQIYEQRTWSFNPYIDASWEFADDFTLDGGLRYNFERKSFDITLNRQGARICEDIVDEDTGRVVPARDCDNNQVWDAVTGYLSVTYHISDDALLYGKYSRGWKAGQLSPGGASGATFTVADPEVIDAFELGLKGAWFDGLLTVEAAVFHYSYEDYQVFLAANDVNSPPQRIVTNADDAAIYGAELQTVLEPMEGFTFTSRFGWIESEFLDFTQEVFRLINQGPTLPPRILPVTIDWTGNRLPNTPRFKWSGSLEYVLDLARWGQVIPRWDYVWTDDVSFDASDGRGAPSIENEIFMPKHAIGQQAYWLHNLRLTYRTPSGSTEIAGWVRNLTNETYKTLAFDASAGAGLVGNLLGDPRTYGVTLSFSW